MTGDKRQYLQISHRPRLIADEQLRDLMREHGPIKGLKPLHPNLMQGELACRPWRDDHKERTSAVRGIKVETREKIVRLKNRRLARRIKATWQEMMLTETE